MTILTYLAREHHRSAAGEAKAILMEKLEQVSPREAESPGDHPGSGEAATVGASRRGPR